MNGCVGNPNKVYTPSPSIPPLDWRCPSEMPCEQGVKETRIFMGFLKRQANPGFLERPGDNQTPLEIALSGVRRAFVNAYTATGLVNCCLRQDRIIKPYFDKMQAAKKALEEGLALDPQHKQGLEALKQSQHCTHLILEMSRIPHSGGDPYAGWIEPDFNWNLLSKLKEKLTSKQREFRQSGASPELQQVINLFLKMDAFTAEQIVNDYPLIHARCGSDPGIDPNQP